ncbi:SLATT domain-containing protein [Streptomyces longispororuber]|uniref:SLATT domain-containing protein n=1 Tax=Streptomyces longispororuber TaxID=68230 RepID=UPI00167E96EC|nr:SLATT domain-containing protein [Streptomyces longispororuber]
MRKPRECRVSHHQPDMQPEGVPHEGQEAGAGASGTPCTAGDGPGCELGPRVFPTGDWGDPAARLDELYRWVERGALDTAAWYLRDRVRKRRAARLLRCGAALGALGGGTLPLLDLTGAVTGGAAWGFVSLLAGVACVGCDRYFGFTSGWMRDVATAQAVQRRLQALQFDWASESVREVLGPTEGTASEAAERCLGVLRRFSEDVTELVRAETVDWMVEFRARGAALAVQGGGGGGGGAPGREPGGVPGRFPLPPGARPNMPRQRPPEPR